MKTFAKTALIVIILAGSLPAFAGNDPVDTEPFNYEPMRISKESLTLEEALQLTLRNDPNVLLDEQGVRLQQGSLEEAQGQFDLILNASLELSYTQKEFTASRLKAEADKRDALRKSIIDNGTKADDLEAVLNLLSLAAEDPDNFHIASDDPTAQQINADMALINALILAADPADRDQIRTLRDEYIAGKITQLSDQVANFRELELGDIERLRKLGAIPSISEDIFGELSLGASKQYRSGLTLSPYFLLNGSDSQVKGKPEDSSFGGGGSEGLYKSEAGIKFTYPLGRGGSKQVITASEESAKIQLEAAVDVMEHSSSTSIYRTMASYWSVVGAMRRLDVARESLDLQERLVKLTKDLVDGDELPKTALSQVEASASNSSAAVRSAERALYESRVRLAQTIGLEVVGEADAPLASTDFPTPPDVERVRAMDSAEIGEFAVMRRRDYMAAKAFEESGRIFYLAANHNLRSTLDLNGSLFYTGVAEDPSFRGGIQGAVGQLVGPSTTLGLSWAKPVGNNTAKGQLGQASASLAQSTIQAGDLRRTIKAGVALTLGALEDTISQIDLSRKTVEYYQSSLQSEAEKLRLGQSTVIDVIYTEQRLTSARNALVASELQYALLLTQLRFDTATLIDGEGDTRRVSARDLLSLPFVN